jgi:hypothetical protein
MYSARQGTTDSGRTAAGAGVGSVHAGRPLGDIVRD